MVGWCEKWGHLMTHVFGSTCFEFPSSAALRIPSKDFKTALLFDWIPGRIASFWMARVSFVLRITLLLNFCDSSRMQALEFEPGLLRALFMASCDFFCVAIPQAVTVSTVTWWPADLRPDGMPLDDPQRPHPPEDHAPLEERLIDHHAERCRLRWTMVHRAGTASGWSASHDSHAGIFVTLEQFSLEIKSTLQSGRSWCCKSVEMDVAGSSDIIRRISQNLHHLYPLVI